MKKISRRKALLAGSALGVGAVVGSSSVFTTQAANSAAAATTFTPVKTPEEYQIAASSIVHRAHQDNQFAQAIVKDPVNVLKQLNIGVDAIRELVHEDDYLRATVPSTDYLAICNFTCICTSGCCITSISLQSAVSQPAPLFGSPSRVVRASPEREYLLDRLVKKGHLHTPDACE